MLSGISKAVRLRLAIAFVAIYGFAILAPAAALACFVEVHGQGHVHVHVHVHAKATTHANHGHDDADHHHPAGDSQASHKHTDLGDASDDTAGTCCAVTMFSAVAPELGVTPVPSGLGGPAFVGIGTSFSGLPPGKLIRPPKLQS